MAEGNADAVHAEVTQEVSGVKNKESISQSVYKFEKLTPGEKITGEKQNQMKDALLARVQKNIDRINDPKLKSNPKFIQLSIDLDALKDRINAAEVEFNTKLDILETNRQLAGKAQLDKAAGAAPAESAATVHEQQIAKEAPERAKIVGQLGELVTGYAKAHTTLSGMKAADFNIDQTVYAKILSFLEKAKVGMKDLTDFVGKNDKTLSEIRDKKYLNDDGEGVIGINETLAILEKPNYVQNDILETIKNVAQGNLSETQLAAISSALSSGVAPKQNAKDAPVIVKLSDTPRVENKIEKVGTLTPLAAALHAEANSYLKSALPVILGDSRYNVEVTNTKLTVKIFDSGTDATSEPKHIITLPMNDGRYVFRLADGAAGPAERRIKDPKLAIRGVVELVKKQLGKTPDQAVFQEILTVSGDETGVEVVKSSSTFEKVETKSEKLMNAANAKFNEKKFSEAAKLYGDTAKETQKEEGERYPIALMQQGKCYMQLRQNEKAYSSFADAVKAATARALPELEKKAKSGQAIAAYNLAKYDEARTLLPDDAEKADSYNAEIYKKIREDLKKMDDTKNLNSFENADGRKKVLIILGESGILLDGIKNNAAPPSSLRAGRKTQLNAEIDALLPLLKNSGYEKSGSLADLMKKFNLEGKEKDFMTKKDDTERATMISDALLKNAIARVNAQIPDVQGSSAPRLGSIPAIDAAEQEQAAAAERASREAKAQAERAAAAAKENAAQSPDKKIFDALNASDDGKIKSANDSLLKSENIDKKTVIEKLNALTTDENQKINPAILLDKTPARELTPTQRGNINTQQELFVRAIIRLQLQQKMPKPDGILKKEQLNALMGGEAVKATATPEKVDTVLRSVLDDFADGRIVVNNDEEFSEKVQRLGLDKNDFVRFGNAKDLYEFRPKPGSAEKINKQLMAARAKINPDNKEPIDTLKYIRDSNKESYNKDGFIAQYDKEKLMYILSVLDLKEGKDVVIVQGKDSAGTIWKAKRIISVEKPAADKVDKPASAKAPAAAPAEPTEIQNPTLDVADRALADEINKILDGENGKPGLRARVDDFLKIDPKSDADVLKAREATRKTLLAEINALGNRIIDLEATYELTEPPANLAKIEVVLNEFIKNTIEADKNFKREASPVVTPQPATNPPDAAEAPPEKLKKTELFNVTKTLEYVNKGGSKKGNITLKGFLAWVADSDKRGVIDTTTAEGKARIFACVKKFQNDNMKDLAKNLQGRFGPKTYEKLNAQDKKLLKNPETVVAEKDTTAKPDETAAAVDYSKTSAADLDKAYTEAFDLGTPEGYKKAATIADELASRREAAKKEKDEAKVVAPTEKSAAESKVVTPLDANAFQKFIDGLKSEDKAGSAAISVMKDTLRMSREHGGTDYPMYSSALFTSLNIPKDINISIQYKGKNGVDSIITFEKNRGKTEGHELKQFPMNAENIAKLIQVASGKGILPTLEEKQNTISDLDERLVTDPLEKKVIIELKAAFASSKNNPAGKPYDLSIGRYLFGGNIFTSKVPLLLDGKNGTLTIGKGGEVITGANNIAKKLIEIAKANAGEVVKAAPAVAVAPIPAPAAAVEATPPAPEAEKDEYKKLDAEAKAIYDTISPDKDNIVNDANNKPSWEKYLAAEQKILTLTQSKKGAPYFRSMFHIAQAEAKLNKVDDAKSHLGEVIAFFASNTKEEKAELIVTNAIGILSAIQKYEQKNKK